MLSFRQLITEAKLLHLEHIEDLVLEEGSVGIKKVFGFFESIGAMLHGNAPSNLLVQEKFDGAPSLIAGINPENGKFFVATKSLFNKTPKINYTKEDVDANHGHAPGLAEKLKMALEHLPKNNIKGIIQGDFLFTQDDLEDKTIDGERYITFKPNTILYAVPVGSDLAKEITQAKVGIIWHTSYTGNTIADLSASFSIDVSGLRHHKDSYFTTTNYTDATGVARFTKSEQKQFTQLFDEAKKIASDINKKRHDYLAADKELTAQLTMALNAKVREGVLIPNEKNTIKVLLDTIKQRVHSGKMKEDEYKELSSRVREYASTLVRVYRLQAKVTEIKLFLISKMEKVKRIGQFIQDGDDLKVTSPEGYVAIHDSETAVKLVDRLNFSRLNATIGKMGGGKK